MEHYGNEIVSELRSEDIEIDKIPGAWVLTYWLSEDVSLRLKVRHSCSQDPDHIIAEVRTRPDEEFQAIHHGMVSVYGLTHLDECPQEWDEMPTTWTRGFMAMAQIWARLTYIAEFGASIAERHASEPQSSRDHISFPTAAEKRCEELNQCQKCGASLDSADSAGST